MPRNRDYTLAGVAFLGAIYPEARLAWTQQKLGSRDSLFELAAHFAGMAFCLAVWARVNPAAVYNPTIFRVLLTAVRVTTIAGLARICRVQRRWFTLLQRHAGRPAYVGRSALVPATLARAEEHRQE